MAKAARDAEALHAAGAAQWGTDESEFLRLLCAESPAHLAVVFDEYAKRHGKTMDQVIESEFSGDIKDAFLALGAHMLSINITNVQSFLNLLLKSYAFSSSVEQWKLKIVWTNEQTCIQYFWYTILLNVSSEEWSEILLLPTL